jgi:translation initiation factor IF-2
VPGVRRRKRTIIKEVDIPSTGLSIRNLSSKLSMRLFDLKKKLVAVGAIRTAKNPKIDDDIIDADTIEVLLLEIGLKGRRVVSKEETLNEAVQQSTLLKKVRNQFNDEDLQKRAPIISIMGHVDHGKTTLIDALRTVSMKSKKATKTIHASKTEKGKKKKTAAGDEDEIDKITDQEAGGITQKLSAFTLDILPPSSSINQSSLSSVSSSLSSNKKGVVVDSSLSNKIVFLDTPGHAAFSMMRGQSTLATDIVVLVVALDDGVQPQTIEALQSALKNNCAVILALNKIDKFPIKSERLAARKRILNILATKCNLLSEDYGGETQVIEISGKTKEGIPELIEAISMQSEIMELKSCFKGLSESVILDTKVEKGRGVIVDVLVKWGCLSVGDAIVIGTTAGKIKSMIDDKGQSIKSAFPSQVIQVLGLKDIPSIGMELLSVENDNKAREIVERRLQLEEMRKPVIVNSPSSSTLPTISTFSPAQARANRRNLAGRPSHHSLKMAKEAEALKAEEEEENSLKIPTIGLIVKADGTGTLDALSKIVSDITSNVKEYCELAIISSSVGDITQADVEKCSSSGTDCMILAFNVGILDNRAKTTAKQLDIPIYRDNIIYNIEDSMITRLESILPKDQTITKEVFSSTLLFPFFSNLSWTTFFCFSLLSFLFFYSRVRRRC